jgi:uncharacterized protein (DUF433 family)
MSDAYESWMERRVSASPETMAGEPVFRGTRLTVRNIGGQLARGVSEAELLADYPYLNEEDLTNARSFVEREGRDG